MVRSRRTLFREDCVICRLCLLRQTVKSPPQTTNMPIACSGRTVLPANIAASMIEETGSGSRSPLRLLVRGAAGIGWAPRHRSTNFPRGGGEGILNPLENEMSALAK